MSLLNKLKNLFRKANYIQIEQFKHIDIKADVPKIITPKTFKCAVCGRHILGVDRFVCKYCNKEHCADHRLPEDHNCPSPKNPFTTTFN